jgi:hypothetical protein
MRRMVIATRRQRGGNGGQDGQRGGASCVLAQHAMRVGPAEISLLVLVVVRGLRSAREQNGNAHRQSDAPADPDVREGTWERTHTLPAVASRYDAIGERRSRFCHFTFVSSEAPSIRSCPSNPRLEAAADDSGGEDGVAVCCHGGFP